MKLSTIMQSNLVKNFQREGSKNLASQFESATVTGSLNEDSRDYYVKQADELWDILGARDNKPEFDSDPRVGHIAAADGHGNRSSYHFEGDAKSGHITKVGEFKDGSGNKTENISVSVTRYSPDSVEYLHLDSSSQPDRKPDFYARANKLDRTGPISVFDNVELFTKRGESILQFP